MTLALRVSSRCSLGGLSSGDEVFQSLCLLLYSKFRNAVRYHMMDPFSAPAHRSLHDTWGFASAQYYLSNPETLEEIVFYPEPPNASAASHLHFIFISSHPALSYNKNKLELDEAVLNIN